MFIEGKILELYFHTERSLFADQQIFVKKLTLVGLISGQMNIMIWYAN